VEEQILIIYAGINGYLDNLHLGEAKRFEEGWYRFVEEKCPDLKLKLKERKEIDDGLRVEIDRAMKEWLQLFTAQRTTAEGSPKS
jgi:F-type H+-transporting ATPase subunit alpha